MPLSDVEARVLGCLLEKQLSVPGSYPLTMNAVVSACNQSSGRDPLMSVSDTQAERAVESLKSVGLIRRVLPSHGARVPKIRQVTDERLGLDEGHRAVLALLLLRGPQTAAELRARGQRLHGFDDVGAAEATLITLSDRNEPLVARLPRRPGERGERWAQLLTGEPSDPSHPSIPSPSAIEVDEELLGPLATLVGSWTGRGEGHYPTIETFAYDERISLEPVPTKPLLAYRSATTSAVDGLPRHGESGWFRRVDSSTVELVVAAGPGLVEVCEGFVDVAADGTRIELESTTVARTSTAKDVTATARTYHFGGDRLDYDLSMAAMGHPLTHHLRATLQRG